MKVKSIIKTLKRWYEEWCKAIDEQAELMIEYPEMFIEWSRFL